MDNANRMKIYLKKILLCSALSFSLSNKVESATAPVKPTSNLAEKVFSALCESGIRHPEIVMRQIIIETGWLKSPFLMERNNLFGFRKKEYLRFADWNESIAYYHKWQSKNYLDKNENYYDFLKRIKYAQAQNYTTVLRRISWPGKCAPKN